MKIHINQWQNGVKMESIAECKMPKTLENKGFLEGE
jgi:hypothetical protein